MSNLLHRLPEWVLVALTPIVVLLVFAWYLAKALRGRIE